jgi:hypothetical protein
VTSRVHSSLINAMSSPATTRDGPLDSWALPAIDPAV